MDFDFVLTEEEMRDFVKRCIEEINNLTENHYSFKVLNCKYPEMTVFCSNGKVYWGTNLTFFRDDVKCSPTALCPNMQEIYIQYMYELFGNEYILTLESYIREEIEEAKNSALERYREEINIYDSKLLNYMLLLGRANKKTLKINKIGEDFIKKA